ncbi:hypothetical protein [Streptomyces tsukubensis]|uniref:hypothetical protein n=1 Tax=Streptomyces tsukubensis TaxID=83656 RepID=UPI00344C9B10
MVRNQRKKKRARQRAERTGASYTSATAGTTHVHEPLPDVDVLTRVPQAAGRTLDLVLAARLVAACRAGCQPCQRSLARKLRTEERGTLAALAGAVYGPLPSPGFVASQATQEWAPLARAGKADPVAAAAALAAVEAMSDDAASDLLEDALDHWAVGGIGADEVTDMIKTVMSPGAPPRQRPADPLDGLRAAGVTVVTLDDLGLGDDVDPYHLAPAYGVFPGYTGPESDPDRMPMLTLYPETEDAGIDDLEARTDWEHWGLHGLPDSDPQWRVRARIADRSLQGLVHTRPDGADGVELWRATEAVSMPQQWWDLLDRTRHVLVTGPVTEPDHQALAAAGDAGELLAVVARAEFV